MPGALDRVNAVFAESRGRGGEQRSSIDQWISEYLLPSGMVNQFTFGGHVYGMGSPNLTYPANKAREFTSDLPGHTAAVKACPPAFAAEMVRALVLSQARFTFRNVRWSPTPRRTFGTRDLGVLERPWVNATTGDLIGDEDPQMAVSEEWLAIAPSIRELPARERRILYLRFFKDMTQTEIAEEIGISQMHVSRLLTETLAKLRESTEPP